MSYIDFIGENIKILRFKKGLSQEQLALNAGINPSYIGQIERGEKNPTIKILEQISNALGVSLLDLLASFDSRGSPMADYSHNKSVAILSPEDIKQYILEVLQDNSQMIRAKCDHPNEDRRIRT